MSIALEQQQSLAGSGFTASLSCARVFEGPCITDALDVCAQQQVLKLMRFVHFLGATVPSRQRRSPYLFAAYALLLRA
eukprot:1159807-Pelagomonas_calceolata.AAC.6